MSKASREGSRKTAVAKKIFSVLPCNLLGKFSFRQATDYTTAATGEATDERRLQKQEKAATWAAGGK
jgi:hypothetical protein